MIILPQLESSTHEVMPPHSQGMYYGSELQIMCCIPLFMLLQFSWLLTYHIMTIVHKNTPKSFSTSICAYNKIMFWNYYIHNLIIVSKNLFQYFKAFLMFLHPFNLTPFFFKELIGCENLEIHQWPIHYGFNLQRIHAYSFPWDNVTQVMDLFKIKITFS